MRDLSVSTEERRVLLRWLRTPEVGTRHRLRAQIVLAAAEHESDRAIARRLRVTPETVARWRERFRTLGIDGLRREAPRAGGSGRTPGELVERVLTATVGRQSPGAAAWSTRSLARALRTNHMTIHRIWKRYGLSNSEIPTTEPRSPWTRADLVGVYRSPRASAVVFGLESTVADPIPPVHPPGIDLAYTLAQLANVLGPGESTERREETRGPTPTSLLVFLRSVEERTPVPARLDAIFDRPLASLGVRVGAWLEHHPRYRVFTTESGEAWRRSAEAWMRRWENVPLDPNSFRGIDAYQEVSRESFRPRSRTGAHAAWTREPGRRPRGGRVAPRSDRGSARRKTPRPAAGPHA
ncbi:MAG: helix-turn-helix domain-containing protein [Thermoplasmata archaeon]